MPPVPPVPPTHSADFWNSLASRNPETAAPPTEPTSAFASEMHADIRHLETQLGIGPGTNGFEGRATTRVYNLLARGALYQQVPVHRVVVPLMTHLLGDGFLVSSLSSITIGRAADCQTSPRLMQLVPELAGVCHADHRQQATPRRAVRQPQGMRCELST